MQVGAPITIWHGTTPSEPPQQWWSLRSTLSSEGLHHYQGQAQSCSQALLPPWPGSEQLGDALDPAQSSSWPLTPPQLGSEQFWDSTKGMVRPAKSSQGLPPLWLGPEHLPGCTAAVELKAAPGLYRSHGQAYWQFPGSSGVAGPSGSFQAPLQWLGPPAASSNLKMLQGTQS